MKIAVVVLFVVCLGLTMGHPLRQALLGLGRFSNSNENDNILDGNQPTEEPVTKTQQLRSPGSEAGEGRGWKGIPRDKRQFSDPSSSSNWNSFRAPDRYFDTPIHLQNWSSQFGRSYRNFDGIQSGRRLRPVSGIYDGGDPVLTGGDSLQNWRALYSEDHF